MQCVHKILFPLCSVTIKHFDQSVSHQQSDVTWPIKPYSVFVKSGIKAKKDEMMIPLCSYQHFFVEGVLMRPTYLLWLVPRHITVFELHLCRQQLVHPHQYI